MILSGPRENIAIVNGLRVKKGDRAGGATVLKVNTSDVELEHFSGIPRIFQKGREKPAVRQFFMKT
jgi:hypothetical protein